MRLVNADEVCCGGIELDKFLEVCSDVLRKGFISKTVVVDPKTNTAVGNVELCATLKELGVKYMPVSYEFVEDISVSLEELGFFDELRPSTYRVFRSSEELLYRNWPTPLVRLKNSSIGGKTVWAKLEGFNPWSMSVKDRVGWYMFKRALERLGSIPKLLVESTSTNTGIAIAVMCNLYGSKLRAYIPSTISLTGEFLLKVFGVEVIRSTKSLTVELIDDIEGIAHKEGALHLNQFYNDDNFKVHLRYTAKELELQFKEAGIVPKGVFGGLGTSGHMSAITFYLKNRFEGVKAYGVVPKVGNTIQGIRRVETGMKWVHHVGLDGIVEVSLEDAIRGVLEVVRKDGIFIGLSSGAVYYAYKEAVEKNLIDDGDYILIMPDIGFKYVEQLMKYSYLVSTG